jgi:hypothetical protein
MDPSVKSWNLACLHGSVKGYERGTVSLQRVSRWAERAFRGGATHEELAEILTPHGLELRVALTVVPRQ